MPRRSFADGWSLPAVRDTLAAQSAVLLTPSPAFHNAPQLALARALTNRCSLDRVFFANSGAEANEGAIKLARKWGRLHRGGAFEIITMHGSFHGRTLGVEVLVSNALSPHIRNIHMDVKKFLFMTSLRARLELRNGMVVTTA